MGDVQVIEAVKAGNLATVEALLASGVDIHQQDEQGWTPLNWAAGKGDVAMVTLLLKHGADIFKVGRDQRTPYMIALAAARLEAAKLLREAEAKGAGERRQNRELRKYCKAYYLKDLRAFDGWSESHINWQGNAEQSAAEDSGTRSFSDDDIVFMHQDLTVTQSMWHNENVIFNQVTPAWEEFCGNILQFKVPDDFDLLPKTQNTKSSG
jgi:ankyrin repeat protein